MVSFQHVANPFSSTLKTSGKPISPNCGNATVAMQLILSFLAVARYWQFQRIKYLEKCR